MNEIGEFLKRIAARSGVQREFFIEKDFPTAVSNIQVVPLYGDYKSIALASSLLLNNYRKHFKNKYLVVCSWPGMQSLFPFASEYWSVKDQTTLENMASNATFLDNHSKAAAELTRSFLEAVDTLTPHDLKKYYDNGFTKLFWSTFLEPERFLPEAVSISQCPVYLRSQFNSRNKPKVFVYPGLRMRSWQRGTSKYLNAPIQYWETLVERLLEEGYDPVCLCNMSTFDMSKTFADRCLYLSSNRAEEILATMRACKCVIDVHTTISRLALLAQVPFVSVTERQIFMHERDYEMDDLLIKNQQREYIFGFSTQLMFGSVMDWNLSAINNIVERLKLVNSEPTNDPTILPVDKDLIRKRTEKRLGTSIFKYARKI